MMLKLMVTRLIHDVRCSSPAIIAGSTVSKIRQHLYGIINCLATVGLQARWGYYFFIPVMNVRG